VSNHNADPVEHIEIAYSFKLASNGTERSLSGTYTVQYLYGNFASTEIGVDPADDYHGPIKKWKPIGCSVKLASFEKQEPVPGTITTSITETEYVAHEDCKKDYKKAQELEGLERRKMIAELIEYGCLEKVETKRPITQKITTLEFRKVLIEHPMELAGSLP
jgi:hypothetical protein